MKRTAWICTFAASLCFWVLVLIFILWVRS
ncbi:hypothetical protein [Serratia marcescens]